MADLLGAPGSLNSGRIISKLNIPISTGNILRAAVARSTPVGLKAKGSIWMPASWFPTK